MKPLWENTFNAKLRSDWSHIGYALDHAKKAGYVWLLWSDNRIYSVPEGMLSKYTIATLYGT